MWRYVLVQPGLSGCQFATDLDRRSVKWNVSIFASLAQNNLQLHPGRIDILDLEVGGICLTTQSRLQVME